MFNENISIYIEIMQAWLPLRNGILQYIRKNDFSLICTVKIVAVKMLILWLMLPRILVGYLKIKRFFCVVYISIGALVIWGCAFKLNGVSRIESVLWVLAIATRLDFFAQGNCYTFLETLGYLETFQICLQIFFWFLYNLQTRTKWSHKTVFSWSLQFWSRYNAQILHTN